MTLLPHSGESKSLIQGGKWYFRILSDNVPVKELQDRLWQKFHGQNVGLNILWEYMTRKVDFKNPEQNSAAASTLILPVTYSASNSAFY